MNNLHMIFSGIQGLLYNDWVFCFRFFHWHLISVSVTHNAIRLPAYIGLIIIIQKETKPAKLLTSLSDQLLIFYANTSTQTVLHSVTMSNVYCFHCFYIQLIFHILQYDFECWWKKHLFCRLLLLGANSEAYYYV